MNQIPPEEQRAISMHLGGELTHPLDAHSDRSHLDQIHGLLEKAMGRQLPRPVIDEELRLKLAIAEAIVELNMDCPRVAKDTLVRALLDRPTVVSNPPF